MGVIKGTIFIIVLAYLSKSVYIFFVNHGIGVHYNNVHPGSCRIVPGITCGSEQISVTTDGLAFITNGFRALTRCNPEYIKGHLYLFNFNHPDNNVTALNIIGEKLNLDSFDPHGMDILEFPDEEIIHVYVVNHADEKESIEVFVYNRSNPNDIVHTSTILDEKFVCLNDIAVLNEGQFYVTNYVKYCKLFKIMMTIELLFKLKTANIVYYNHGHTTIVATDSFYNGITLSKDKSKVVTAVGSSREVHVFDQNDMGGLTLKKKVFLGHIPDNIFVDKQTGNFYVGYFKHPLSIQMVSENKTEYCSASGAMVSVDSEVMDNDDVREVFYDSGEMFVSAASSLVHYKGQYLIGTVFDKLGYCRK